jgi:hypothetical protein
MFGKFNKIMDMLTLDALKGVSVNRRLELVKPKPKHMDVTLRIEKLSGKCILEKDSDLVLRNFVRLLYHILANYAAPTDLSVTFTDVTGTARTGYPQYIGSISNPSIRTILGWNNSGDVGQDNQGIVIGSGTTSPSRVDYTLVSKIAHGTGTGQIYYNRQTYELLTDYSFRLTREFTNAGSDLSIAEAGLIYPTQIAGTIYYILYFRDTFTPVTVTAGNGIRVRYTFSF